MTSPLSTLLAAIESERLRNGSYRYHEVPAAAVEQARRALAEESSACDVLERLLPILDRIGMTTHEEQAVIREARLVCGGIAVRR